MLLVEDWLLAAAPDVQQARWEWGDGGLTFLRCGGLFTAIRLPGDLVRAAAGSSKATEVDAYLAEALGGPVIASRGRYYALVPPGTADEWPSLVVECLGEGTYLGVPRVDRIGLDEETQASYWSVVIPRPGVLCKAADVLALVMAGGCLSDDEDDES
ncbi:hypothetical protein ACWD0Z_06080 [Streptomyces sp. NPDC003007]